MIALFCKLLIGHALFDYPLQGDFIAKFKNRHIPSPISGSVIWFHLMTAHCLLHAGAVWYLTGSGILAGIEFTLHFIFDVMKCEGWTNFHVDQVLHVLCKAGYAVVIGRNLL